MLSRAGRVSCMASAALSMRLASARRMASGSASTTGRPASRSRWMVMPSSGRQTAPGLHRPPGLMQQARGCDAGNSASAENWFTSVRRVPTQPRMTSLHFRITFGESVWPRSRCRSMRSALSAMGVSGFLISSATRCATSFHANAVARAVARRCLRQPERYRCDRAPAPAARP